MKQKFANALSLALIMAMLFTSLVLADATPTITSDKEDYAPGELVTLTGTGWQPGESVHIFVNDNVGATWSRNVDVVAADDGTFTDSFNLPNWFVATYSVTATGSSGLTAATSFTDADVSYNPTRYPASGWQSVTAGSSFSFSLDATKAGGGENPVVTGFSLENEGGGSPTCGAAPGGASAGAISASWVSTTQTFPKTLTSTVTAFPFTVAPPTGTAAGFYKGVIKFTTSAGGRGNGTVVCLQVAAPADTTAPDTTITANPANPTNSTSASFSFTGTDNATPAGSLSFECSLDGAAFAPCTSPKSYSGLSTGNHSFQVKAKDAANNVDPTPASYTWTITPPDTTAPVITPQVNGTLGNNSWYTSNVTVSWSVIDNESAVSSSNGCGSTTINADTAGVTLTCTATSAGGTNSQSVTIKRDASTPSISATANPPANSNGWNNSDVTVSYACSDNGPSGVDQAASDDGDDLLTASGTASGTCVDMAGNSANTSYTAQIDKVKPVISGSRAPGANANGWNNTDVVVSFSCTDSGGSGLDMNTVAGATVSTEGANQTVTNTGTCTDKAGNIANSATVSGISIDKTLPTASASASPAANANGWNKTDVTVSFNGNDGSGSGIDSCSDPVVLSSEGAGQSASGTCTDKAGNESASATASGISIDKTAPTSISFVGGPAAGGNYYFGSVPSAPTCTADGAISELASCLVSGYGTTVGNHTMTATATDNAGNSSTSQQSYTVLAWTLNGFYQPVDMSPQAPTTIVWNTVKNGSTVPLKFEVFAGSTELTNTSIVNQPLRAVGVTCAGSTADDIELTATGGTSLRYDTTAGQFIYNWQTPKRAGACYLVTVSMADGSSLSAYFKLK